MASFLYPCSNVCSRMVRTMRPTTDPVTCASCEEAIAANKAREWVHRGGGHYVNTITGEKRRGKPA